MNYYQHHIGDFIRDTSRLTDSQCMAYLRMIWVYYETEAPLENDLDALAFKIGANVPDVEQILKHYFFLHDGMWHNSRCDTEILSYREKSAKAKKSADARWNNANAMRTHTKRNADAPVFDANQEPITNNQEPIKPIPPKSPKGDDRFAMFWLAYPRKVAKPQALKAFNKISPDEQLMARIMAALNNQKRSDQWTRDGGAYIPHPATWLNNQRWEDEVTHANTTRPAEKLSPLDRVRLANGRPTVADERAGYSQGRDFVGTDDRPVLDLVARQIRDSG